MTAPKKPKAAKNIAVTETEKLRIRNRPSGTIGSAARDSIQRKTAAISEAGQDQAADGRVRPVAGALVGQADQDQA